MDFTYRNENNIKVWILENDSESELEILKLRQYVLGAVQDLRSKKNYWTAKRCYQNLSKVPSKAAQHHDQAIDRLDKKVTALQDMLTDKFGPDEKFGKSMGQLEKLGNELSDFAIKIGSLQSFTSTFKDRLIAASSLLYPNEKANKASLAHLEEQWGNVRIGLTVDQEAHNDLNAHPGVAWVDNEFQNANNQRGRIGKRLASISSVYQYDCDINLFEIERDTVLPQEFEDYRKKHSNAQWFDWALSEVENLQIEDATNISNWQEQVSFNTHKGYEKVFSILSEEKGFIDDLIAVKEKIENEPLEKFNCKLYREAFQKANFLNALEFICDWVGFGYRQSDILNTEIAKQNPDSADLGKEVIENAASLSLEKLKVIVENQEIPVKINENFAKIYFNQLSNELLTVFQEISNLLAITNYLDNEINSTFNKYNKIPETKLLSWSQKRALEHEKVLPKQSARSEVSKKPYRSYAAKHLIDQILKLRQEEIYYIQQVSEMLDVLRNIREEYENRFFETTVAEDEWLKEAERFGLFKSRAKQDEKRGVFIDSLRNLYKITPSSLYVVEKIKLQNLSFEDEVIEPLCIEIKQDR